MIVNPKAYESYMKQIRPDKYGHMHLDYDTLKWIKDKEIPSKPKRVSLKRTEGKSKQSKFKKESTDYNKYYENIQKENPNIDIDLVKNLNKNDEYSRSKYYIRNKPKKPKTKWGISDTEYKELRKRILFRDAYTCQDCGSIKKLHIHHIVERYKGGSNDDDNLITLCAKCHAEKHKDLPVYNIMIKAV